MYFSDIGIFVLKRDVKLQLTNLRCILCREKMKLEQEKTQKEADIKIKNGEVLALQKELDAVSNTVKQLEMQKAEAQKRLDELDDKVTSPTPDSRVM